ncbi:hypothetical protein COT49_00335 [candidate division WWE3 bacterium CG08_land_8_20_14_0_20_40_13]|uniref:Aminoglycoside phosphotransferase domain-containing protein n=1 Tax=candidate division WWE3 bacterium CG08_land_8_20_14_0_20_40_13 TaxID=1975084 RepID=A0A2H0XF12_UNCKA|nr:MAG: hypothetical protein COT49_00335 [candidate division WWE3 bacterium CG08_land_8_20_14_0_20_40_13]
MEIDLPQEILNIIRKYKYQAVEVLRRPDGGLIRSFVIVLSKDQKNDKKYILKFFWLGSGDSRKRFLRELKFLLARDRFPNVVKSHILPIVEFSFGDGFRTDTRPWFITKQYSGQPLAKFIGDLGIKKGLFTIPNFESLAKFLISMWEIPEKDLDLWFYDIYHAETEISNFYKNNPELLSKVEWENLKKFININSGKVFKNLKISHRDLYPENILVRQETMSNKGIQLRFKMIDWEYVAKVPIGWDPAFFGLLFWRERIWHDRIYALFYSRYRGPSSEFNLSYRWCNALLALRFLYQITAFGSFYHGLSNDETCYYKKYLIASIKDSISGHLVSPDDTRYMISGKVISQILNKYNIGHFVSYTLYYLSKGNTVFKVSTTTGSFVFRIYNSSRNLNVITRELRLFEKLRANMIPSYHVFTNKMGRRISTVNLYNKMRRVAILSYLRGSSPTRHGINNDLLIQAGATLRSIHNLKISHGDYSKRNVLFCKGRVSGVIDLEFGREGVSQKKLKLDLAKSLALWCMSVTLNDLDIKERVLNFLKGYWGISFSPAKMRRIIPLVISALDKEEKIHWEIYKGGGEGFGVIRTELLKI